MEVLDPVTTQSPVESGEEAHDYYDQPGLPQGARMEGYTPIDPKSRDQAPMYTGSEDAVPKKQRKRKSNNTVLRHAYADQGQKISETRFNAPKITVEVSADETPSEARMPSEFENKSERRSSYLNPQQLKLMEQMLLQVFSGKIEATHSQDAIKQGEGETKMTEESDHTYLNMEGSYEAVPDPSSKVHHTYYNIDNRPRLPPKPEKSKTTPTRTIGEHSYMCQSQVESKH